ncbi:MAG TPA: prolyl oligopeptidase family serine peptidase [Pirellulales bacterium]|jgi:prolyl oligopeptidase|nr:prolyl oligopeptidase family serine peptidase [Pirellulales bacterium]
MKRIASLLIAAGLCAGCTAEVKKPEAKKAPPVPVSEAALKYPDARRGDQVDEYHGTKIADPYRWLEDPDSPETRAWIEAENKLTFGFLETIPQRETIRSRLTKLWDYERFGVPTKRGGRYLFTRNDGLQNQSVLYTLTALDGKPQLLLDPNKLSAAGTVALTGYTLSDDGSLLAYGLAQAGSDWQEWRVRDVETAKDRDDLVRWVKFSGASWSHSGDGFYYSRYDEPAEGEKFTGTNYYQKLYFHRLGEPQEKDKLIYERHDQKEWGFYGHVTDDGRYLIIHVSRGTDPKNQVFYLDLAEPDAKVVELITGFDADYSFVDNDGAKFWFRTDLDAPRYKMIAVDCTAKDRDGWQTTIAEADDLLEDVSRVGGRFFATYLHDASSRVALLDDAGKPAGEIKLPAIGSVGGFGGRNDDTETFYAFTSFTAPTTIYRYDIAAAKSEVFREPKVDFDARAYETKQVFYSSRDGTRVPMFIVHRRGLKLDGNNPTYLYGYGGFNISLTPSFDVRRVAWLELGGIFAMPNLRGGGEYGREWHEAGMITKKQHVFDDFIAAAEYLIRERYTSTPKLAIAGGSNGGLLVGACMTERPELFGAAIPKVGVLDMLRFHKFTIGWAWTSEFGSSDEPEQFATLLKYSPLQNIKPGTHYPATLIETADHDDRVVPAHSFKFAAALQAAQAGDAPVLIRIETSAGHGAGTPTSKMIDETADSYAFLVRVLGMDRTK